MDCPLCNTEMLIHRAEYRAENDETAEQETKLVHCCICRCRNPACRNFEKEFSGEITPLPLSKKHQIFCEDCGVLLYEGDEKNPEEWPTCPVCLP